MKKIFYLFTIAVLAFSMCSCAFSPKTQLGQAKTNVITNVVQKELVGKYAVKEDDKTYFEIRKDGTVYISLNAMSGYSVYENVTTTAYYSQGFTVLSFTLNSGEATFPGSSLSIDFVSTDATNTVFRSLTYQAEDHLEFVKL